MKKTLILITIASFLSCKAQTIVPLYGSDDFDDNSNFYLKDVHDNFNKFEGRWKYTENNISFTLLFKKELKVPTSSGLFVDYLLGEYQYVENGVEKVNTLNLIDSSSIQYYEHLITGSSLVDKNARPACDTCSINDRGVRLTIRHPDLNDVYSEMIVRHFTDNGVEKIRATLLGGGPGLIAPDRTDPVTIDIPDGEYILIKQ